jgi:hypothetical protein
MIQHRVSTHYYKKMTEFEQDFNLMIENATTYHEEGSEVYADAIALKDSFNQVLQAMCPNGQIEITPQDYEDAAKASERKRSREDGPEEDAGLKIKLTMGKKAKLDKE